MGIHIHTASHANQASYVTAIYLTLVFSVCDLIDLCG